MRAKTFLDTNVFVYSFDSRQPAKQRKAQEWIEKSLEDQSGLISWQVVQEFLNVASKKFSPSLASAELRSYLDRVLLPLCEVYPSADLYRSALEIQQETGFSFYDSLIVSASLKSGCRTLLTDDLQHGQRVGSLVIHNPFRS